MTTEAEALASMGRFLAHIWRDHNEWYREGGAERVAAMEWPNATPEKQAQIAERYEQARQRAMKDSAA